MLFQLIFTEMCQAVSSNGFLDRDDNSLKMYRAKELKQLLQSHKCEIIAISASNYLSLNRNKFLQGNAIATDAWSDFLQWELDFCAESGCLDGGTHIIAVVKKASKFN